MTLRRVIAWPAAVLVALALPAAAEAGDDDAAARELLARAFARTFEQPGVRKVELRIARGGRIVARRAFDAAFRREGDGGRTLVRFTAPDYLRGHALLLVDGAGSSDSWLYQPEERRLRRIATTQKSDSFYGSDLTFEDLERPRWTRWRAAFADELEEAGARRRAVEAVPPPDSQYARLRVLIDPDLVAVARIDFFREAGAPPVKRLHVDLAGLAEERGFLGIRRITVEQLGRAASTELRIGRMEIDPALADRVFSAARLEREGEDLFELAGRGERAEAR
jgi:hypothetical protein